MERVSINVGGCWFETTMKTLSKIPVLANIDWEKEEYSIFIDRDAHPFSIILSYLRTDFLPEFDNLTIEQLMCECEYYQLKELKTRLMHKKRVGSKDLYLEELKTISAALSKLL
jgi:hypothetical protein